MKTRGVGYLDKFSVQILELLASDPLGKYYQREIARHSRVSIGKTN